MALPKRVQLRRKKGWRMPPNTVKVDRSTIWGNPFPVNNLNDARRAVGQFHLWLSCMNLNPPELEARRAQILDLLLELRGLNLACWCALDAPCHADVLLAMANAAVKLQTRRKAGGSA